MVGDPPVTDREHLGEVRAGELMAAAEILGIAKVHFLGFLDGQLANVPREQLVERAVELIRRVRPHVLVGFGPEGVSRHADHKVMCEVALSAFDRSADPTWYPAGGATPGRPSSCINSRSRRRSSRGGTPPFPGFRGRGSPPSSTPRSRWRRRSAPSIATRPRRRTPDGSSSVPATGSSRGRKRTSLPGRGFPGYPCPRTTCWRGFRTTVTDGTRKGRPTPVRNALPGVPPQQEERGQAVAARRSEVSAAVQVHRTASHERSPALRGGAAEGGIPVGAAI